jgi:TctA family transporter
MDYIIWLLLGTGYGFLFGVIPVAGASVGLISIFGFIEVFRADPSLIVVFTTALVVSAAIGDSFASVVMGIPGGNGSAATMLDGFPMTQKGEGARALGAALSTSTMNGFIWGALVFLFLPYYAPIVLSFAIPEILAFLLLAFSAVCFVNSQYWFRGIIALAIGLFLGLVGQHPITGENRFTFGWDYLGNAIQMAPLLAGVLAFPELIKAYRNRHNQIIVKNIKTEWQQIWQGFKDSWIHKVDGLRGGFIGAIVGIIPGIGGSVADWLSYGQTVAWNKNEKIPFGEGNIKGVIGTEGSNNAQKASAYVPTVLFGIPGAHFEAIIMSLFLIVGIELGSPALLQDLSFFDTLASSYFWSLIISFFAGLVFIRYAVRITNLPFIYYFWPIIVLLLWSSVQYTGYWEDYAIFGLCCLFGIFLTYFKLSRAALIIGFVLADRLEATFNQYIRLYEPLDIFTRPISGSLVLLATVAIVYGIFYNKTRINYV